MTRGIPGLIAFPAEHMFWRGDAVEEFNPQTFMAVFALCAKRRETQRQKLMASIGHQGLAWFDAQVLRDEALSSPLAALALANGCKVLSAPKAKEAA